MLLYPAILPEETMLEKVHHIGVVVKDLDEALRAYRDVLGLCLESSEVLPDRGVRMAFLPVGETHLELLESISESSAIGKFLRVHGEGIHHICFAVDSIEATLAGLKQLGVKLVDEQPRTGAGGARVAFIHPSSMHGVLIELRDEGKCLSNGV